MICFFGECFFVVKILYFTSDTYVKIHQYFIDMFQFLSLLFYSFQLTFCCLDPDDYSEVPLLQYQQDSILREFNKTLLGFRQKCPSNGILPKRLSPIGESFSSTPEKESIKKTVSELSKIIVVK